MGNQSGPVAEWLGRALQKLLHQFESGRDLPKEVSIRWLLFFTAIPDAGREPVLSVILTINYFSYI